MIGNFACFVSFDPSQCCPSPAAPAAHSSLARRPPTASATCPWLHRRRLTMVVAWPRRPRLAVVEAAPQLLWRPMDGCAPLLVRRWWLGWAAMVLAGLGDVGGGRASMFMAEILLDSDKTSCRRLLWKPKFQSANYFHANRGCIQKLWICDFTSRFLSLQFFFTVPGWIQVLIGGIFYLNYKLASFF
jgi:hypothetical protein